jgi:hypothetical protein
MESIEMSPNAVTSDSVISFTIDLINDSVFQIRRRSTSVDASPCGNSLSLRREGNLPSASRLILDQVGLNLDSSSQNVKIIVLRFM